jgi:hypothetical protein
MGKTLAGNPITAHFAMFLRDGGRKIRRQRNYDCLAEFEGSDPVPRRVMTRGRIQHVIATPPPWESMSDVHLLLRLFWLV